MGPTFFEKVHDSFLFHEDPRMVQELGQDNKSKNVRNLSFTVTAIRNSCNIPLTSRQSSIITPCMEQCRFFLITFPIPFLREPKSPAGTNYH